MPKLGRRTPVAAATRPCSGANWPPPSSSSPAAAQRPGVTAASRRPSASHLSTGVSKAATIPAGRWRLHCQIQDGEVRWAVLAAATSSPFQQCCALCIAATSNTQ